MISILTRCFHQEPSRCSHTSFNFSAYRLPGIPIRVQTAKSHRILQTGHVTMNGHLSIIPSLGDSSNHHPQELSVIPPSQHSTLQNVQLLPLAGSLLHGIRIVLSVCRRIIGLMTPAFLFLLTPAVEKAIQSMS
jgi:hypothetical protein